MSTPEELTDGEWYREFVCNEPILQDIVLSDVIAAASALDRESAPMTYQRLAKALGISRHKAYDLFRVLVGLDVARRAGTSRWNRLAMNPHWKGDITSRVKYFAAMEPSEFSEEQRILGVLTLASYGAL